MNTIKHTKYCNPVVTRLKNQHSELSTEINELNRELIILKEHIRHKQKDLREINVKLIQKATRGPFLAIVSSAYILKPSTNTAKATLTCLHGGKASL